MFILLISCDDATEKKEPLGAPCDASTACVGFCNTDLHDGMCVVSCDESHPCATGTCFNSGELSYCLPDCTENRECRDNYSCIEGMCRPISQIGSPCDDAGDCELYMEKKSRNGYFAAPGFEPLLVEGCPDPNVEFSHMCIENFCSLPCDEETICPDGFTCGLSDGCYYCITE